MLCKNRNSHLFILSEETMDVDPNYDPSDFLMSGLPLHKVDENAQLSQEMLPMNQQENTDAGMKIHDDLAVSESDDENPNTIHDTLQDDDDAGDLWF